MKLPDNFLLEAINTQLSTSLKRVLMKEAEKVVDEVVVDLQKNLQISFKRWVEHSSFTDTMKISVEVKRK